MDVHFYWQQGIQSAPAFVQRNYRLWARLVGTHRLHCHDGADAARAFRELDVDAAAFSAQIRSDLFRLYLLQSRGGLWVDASVLPTPAVRTWLTDFVEPLPYFLFRWPRGRLRHTISTWLIYASHPNGYLVSQWLAALTRYFCAAPRRLATPHTGASGIVVSIVKSLNTDLFCDGIVAARLHIYPYFISHYVYKWLEHTDPHFRAIAGSIPFRSAVGPHELQYYLRATGAPDPRRVQAIVDAHVVHKAEWRAPARYRAAQDYVDSRSPPAS